MSHKSSAAASTSVYGLLSLLVLVIGIVFNYLIRPDLFGASIAYSEMGVQPVTKYIFTGTLLVSALLFILESHYVYNKWQRIGCYLVSTGFVVVALVPIRGGEYTDFIHGLGALLAMIGLLLNIVIGINNRWKHLKTAKRLFYLLILGSALSSAATFILSSGTIQVFELSGYAELSGITAFAGWVLIDFGDIFS